MNLKAQKQYNGEISLKLKEARMLMSSLRAIDLRCKRSHPCSVFDPKRWLLFCSRYREYDISSESGYQKCININGKIYSTMRVCL